MRISLTDKRIAAVATMTLTAGFALPAAVGLAAPASARADRADVWQVTDFPVRYAGLSSIETVGGKAVTVGFGIAPPFRFTPLAAVWDGTDWDRQPVRLHGVSSDTQLADVDVTSASDGWAVGRGFDGEGSIAVTARWNGKVWSGVPTDDITGDIGFLGVTAVSRDDVWAVGQRQVGSTLGQVIGHYDGDSWSAVKTPKLEHVGAQTALTSVAHDDDGTVWAVGIGGVSLRYDGKRWHQVAVPKVDGAYVDFQKVRWLRADGLWAVGYAGDDSGRHPVALHWDGAVWQQVQAPAGDVAQLNDVTVFHDTVVAVGYGSSGFYGLRLDADGPSRPLRLPPGESALFGAASNRGGSELWVVGSGPVGDEGKIAPYAAVR